MHTLLQPCTCSVCLARDKQIKKPDTAKLHAAFRRIIEWLHAMGEFRARDIKTPIVRQLISETAAIFNEAVDTQLKEVQPDDLFVRALKQSGYVFSGFKTLAQVKEAEQMLIDESGKRKPFEQFLNDVQTIDKTYNETYLYSEYKFAVASAQMADKWKHFEKDKGRYDLQYRTAGDDRVRDTHAELHNVTLPFDSPFWDKYYPPNGWGCRCTVVQVRKGKYPRSDLADAMKKGDAASSGKFQKMFRFNPGKSKSLFPAHNPYTPSKCAGCTLNKFPLAKIPDNELCAACPIIREMIKSKEELYRQRADVFKQAMAELRSKKITHNQFKKEIEISRKSINEFLNQPHKHIKEKNRQLLHIEELIRKSTYLGIAEHYIENQNFESHIFEVEIAGEPSWIIVREYLDKRVLLHSISDSEKIRNKIKK